MVKDTHKLMLDHSKAKVELYGKYLQKYLMVICQDKFTTDVHLYDLFCGEGIYDNYGIGSPIIAIREFKKIYNLPISIPNIHLTFNDIGLGVVEKLKENIKKEYEKVNWVIRYFNLNFSEILPQVISEISGFKKEKAIIFIDPKGYKEISITKIRSLLELKKTEVLLFLPIRDMYRFANMKKEKIGPGHEPLLKFMEEILPERVSQFVSQIDFINQLKKGFKNILSEYFVDTFIIERDKGQFFCLFFFTSHIRGYEKMLEAKWELDENEGRIWRVEKSESMFSGNEVLDIEGKLKKYIEEKRRYNGDIYKFCLQESFLPKHANEILEEWQKRNQVIIVNLNGSPGRKGAFYISYDNFISEPKKIYFEFVLTLF